MENNEKFLLPEQDIILKIRTLSKALKQDFDNRLAEFDLTSQQGRILFHIHRWTLEGKEVHQNDIENHFGFSKSTVSGFIARLEKKGLITKTNSHPFVILTTTEKGKGIVDTIHNSRNYTIEKLFKGITDEDRKMIMFFIDKLITNMKEDELDVAKN